MQALVIKNTGSLYTVLTDNGNTLNCALKGNCRIKGIRTTNPVAVGDRVEVSVDETMQTGYITAIEPRRNYNIRRAANLSNEAHNIAANLDSAFLIVTLVNPVTSTTFIDRFLATAEAYRIKATIVINKIDLLTEPDDKELLEAMAYLYRSIGYKVIECSAETGEGIEELRHELKDKVSLLSGNSGVGKSTLINRLIPGLNLRTAEISESHLTGMHTTTFSEMFKLPEGGYIIDTPGVRGFGTIDFDAKEVSHFFPEIFEAGLECRYSDCSHTHEPGCEVRRRLDENLIAASRYASYLSILEDDVNHEKYRKPF